jgi:hypothetical protein
MSMRKDEVMSSRQRNFFFISCSEFFLEKHKKQGKKPLLPPALEQFSEIAKREEIW